MKKQNINFDGAFPSSVYFASIGLGFMIVEITWMQYLMVFLGHPVYSLSVVLATLLLSSGVGSFLTEKINMEGGVKHIYRPFGVLIFLLIVFLPASQPVLNFFRGSETLVRIIISIVLLIFPSMFMGIAFPAGMKIANRTLPSVTPWLWGINGAMSVCASVISVTISMWAGISISYYTGVFCYVLAGISLGFMMRNCNFPVKLHQ